MPSTPTSSLSLRCLSILTPIPISIVNLGDLGHLGGMDPNLRDNESEEIVSQADGGGNSHEKWRVDLYRSVVTGDMLVTWRAKYSIHSLVEIVVLDPRDRASTQF